MTCLRCNGFAIEEIFTDNGGYGSGGFEVKGWRCVMCGGRGEGNYVYGTVIGTLAEGARRHYGAVHQYRDRGHDDE